MNRPHSSTPTPVGALLAVALPPLAERLLALAIRRSWEEVVGDVARRARPGELETATLTVIVDNSPWLQELKLRERELLSRLQARYGTDAIRALRFTLGTSPRATAPGGPPPAAPLDNLTEAETAWVASTTAGIRDPTLADTLRRLLLKDALVQPKARAHR